LLTNKNSLYILIAHQKSALLFPLLLERARERRFKKPTMIINSISCRAYLTVSVLF
jgi:bacteriorhodopsin